MNRPPVGNDAVSGEFLTLAGERYYAIRDVDTMAPFFVSLVSDSDHWLFISSTGGLTAGRVSPETALFPYITVDKIHESSPHTGSKTLIKGVANGQRVDWEPFNRAHDGRYSTSRNLYKNILGNKLCFEEVNHDLQLAFRYSWLTSSTYGFVRRCELENLGQQHCELELIDGLQNILRLGPHDLLRPIRAIWSTRTSGMSWSRIRGWLSLPSTPESPTEPSRASR